MGSTDLDTQVQIYLKEAEERGRIISLPGDGLPNGGEGADGLCCKGTFLAPGQLAAQKDFKVTLQNFQPASRAPACTGVWEYYITKHLLEELRTLEDLWKEMLINTYEI